MKTAELTNNFHNSRANVRIHADKETILSRSTAGRVRRKLCGIKNCQCSEILGTHGLQYFGNYLLDISWMPNSTVMIRVMQE